MTGTMLSKFNASVLALCVLCASTISFAQDRAFTADAMWGLKRLADPAISPDGRMAVVPVTTYDVAENKSNTDLWLLPTKPGRARQLTSGEANDSAPAWSPDGQWIAFVSKRGEDEESQLYVIAVDGGEARRVTNVPTGVLAPKWFPDSKRIAFLSQVWPELKTWAELKQRMKERAEPKMTAQVWDKAPIAHWDRLLDHRKTHVYAIGINGGEPVPITLTAGVALDPAEPDVDSYDIAPDGTEIAFASDTDLSGIDQNFDIFIMPIEGGAPTNLTTENTADDLSPKYSPDGRLLAFRQQRIKDFYADRARLMLIERKSKAVRSVTEQWDRSVDGLVWAPDGESLFGSIDDAGARRIYRFDINGGEPRAITREHSFSSLAVAGTAPVIVALRQSFIEPPTLVSIIARNGTATKLSDFNDAALADLMQGRVENVTYAGAKGEPVQMWIVYPPNFTPDKRWPLYLLLHGGPHNAMTDGYQWRWNAQVFANWGYVTAWHNFHGSSGFGQAWTDSITQEWGELPYEDTIKAAEWFAQKPWIDSERMAAGGGSYGGYLASYLLGREHPFKTLVAHAAVYNSYTQYASDYGASKKRFGEFWEDFERFHRNSPHMSAANFRTPTLVIHGQQDLRVPVNHGIELFNTLQNRGVPSQFVYFPDENHWILKPQNSLFWYETKRKWLEKYVPPGPTDMVAPMTSSADAQSDVSAESH